MSLESRIVEGYIENRLSVPDGVLQWLLNTYVDLYHRLDRLIGRPTTIVPEVTEEIAARSRELMEAHYDMPLSLFENFLGETMKYSMALWERGAADLDAAQRDMMDDLCDKAGMADGMTLLDIGCGFGSFAVHVLRRFPQAQVHGLTLSRTQADYIRARQAEPGHPLNTPNFTLTEGDFNDASFGQPFDRIVSIGVFEHISNLDRALEKVRSFIKPDGRCLLHYIVYRPPKGREAEPRQDPFVDRYIFPGGRVWAEPELYRHQGHFSIESSWYMNGSNYRRTLEAWLDNFRRNLPAIEASGDVEPRKLRLWRFYLQACIATFNLFRGTYYGNAQYLLLPRA